MVGTKKVYSFHPFSSAFIGTYLRQSEALFSFRSAFDKLPPLAYPFGSHSTMDILDPCGEYSTERMALALKLSMVTSSVLITIV
jgi:hypothetical protein